MWNKIEEAMNRGEFPALFVNGRGDVCLDGVSGAPTLPKKLLAKLPAEILAKANELTAQRQAAEQDASNARAIQIKAENEATRANIELWADKRVWGLCGFYVEEMTCPRYTYKEIQAWHSWCGQQQFKGSASTVWNPELSAVCYGSTDSVDNRIVSVGLFEFFDIAGLKSRHKAFDFNSLVKDFDKFTAERRESKAGSN